uniref:sphingomyelin phosphodiesterase n=1 Tax=Esox lucius TaxID=8010 RepID=A0A3P8Z1C6_ESOLU
MADHDTIRLRVFSLNCWGIRYLSKHRLERYAMIGELLSREQHDIVLLQEVWSENDFLGLKRKLSSSHPHSHYFKSGVIGSGLATFSRHRIHDAFLYRYSLNGYPYMAHHGDWFGGKAVGVVILKIGRLTAHVYVTHLHAEYCRDKDSYLPHRVVQAWELQHFIRHTSSGADLVILGGDLNMHPQDLGTRLLRTYTGLLDGYTETAKFDGCEGGITLIADNPFINPKELCPFENGVRIDYILYKVMYNLVSKKVGTPHKMLMTTECNHSSGISSSTVHNIIKRFRESGEISVYNRPGRRSRQYWMAVIFAPSGGTALKTDKILLWKSLHGFRNTSENHCL